MSLSAVDNDNFLRTAHRPDLLVTVAQGAQIPSEG